MGTNDKLVPSLDQALKRLKQNDLQPGDAQVIESALTEFASNLEKKEDEVWQLTHILSLMPGNIYWKNRDGVYLGCNDNTSRSVGFSSPEEVIGKTLSEILGEENTDVARNIDQSDTNLMISGEKKYYEEMGVNSRKESAIYLTQKGPFYNRHGQIAGMLGVSFDISDRKEMEIELKIAKEQAEKASIQKSEFIANMSHDVKTPLAGIISIAELLTYHLHGEDLSFAQTLLSSSRQLLAFFDNCLEVFKLEVNALALTSSSFNIEKLLLELQELFQPICISKGLAFHVHCHHSAIVPLLGNRSSIYRILLNLIGNAVKFTPKGSVTIHTELSQQPNKKPLLKLVVEDTGIGIPSDKLNIIFDRFVRLTPSYKGKFEGSGIGLYVVQKTVTLMGGKIHVISHEGKGSRFTIELPIDVAHLETPTTSSLPESTTFKPSIEKLTSLFSVLLVEDNLIVQRIQNALLTSLNCHVEIAESGEKAIELFQQKKYDLVFMDLGLPGIQGDVATKELREIEKKNKSNHTPIIGLTAHTSDEIDQQCLSAGMDRVIAKPLSLNVTKAIVEEFA